MIRRELVQLLAERTELRRMIESTPTEDVLDRGSLTSRLEAVEHQISETKSQ